MTLFHKKTLDKQGFVAERQFHTYKLSTSTVYLNLLYKLRVTNVGLDVSNPKKNQRELIKID